MQTREQRPRFASDFGALQKALGGRGGKRSAAGAILYAFDLLYLNGQDLRSLPLGQRRELLGDTLVRARHSSLRFSEEVDVDGGAYLDLACKLGLEGIIANDRDAPHRSGRGGDWLKIKCSQSETFAIIGYEPSPVALGGIGKLLLAARRGDSLVYVGGVGTGFTQASGTALRKQMDKLMVLKSAAGMRGRRKTARWIKPDLLAEISFRAWTDDGKLRHASFKGLREGEDAADMFELD
ncbi:hypothetical protein ASE63_04855 [Bosea sp. Root381]|uniref:ATP dependent DNA ligase n=1 Tax=Bosea sp. Root381 TaxID=1736524 RepID=UPI000700F323|nr:hypothetical protein [Bosea sp. Root381]KRE09849.1 hypothetical protein ASE63_04855 [Bosea sp. Root381]